MMADQNAWNVRGGLVPENRIVTAGSLETGQWYLSVK